MAQRAGGVVGVVRRRDHVVEGEVLSQRAIARDELLEEVGDELPAVVRAAARVGDGRELVGQDGEGRADALHGKRQSDERGLGGLRAHRRGRDAAEGEARVADGATLVGAHEEGTRDDGDVHLAALAHLEAVAANAQPVRGAIGDADGHHHLVGLHRGLAVAQEEVRERDDAPPAHRGELHRRVEGHQHRGEVADGRGRDQVARERRAVAHLPRRKHRQHLTEGRQPRAEPLFDLGEGGRAADADDPVAELDGVEFSNRLGRDQVGEGPRLLVELDAHLGGARDQHRVGEGRPQREQLVDGLGPVEALALPPSEGERRQRRQGVVQPEVEAVALVALLQRVVHRVADGPIPGASTQVAAELVGHPVGLVAVGPVVALEHGHHDARGAVAALRAVAVGHRCLHRVRPPLREPLDGEQLAPVDHRKHRDAAAERAPRGVAVRVAVAHRQRAGAAVPLGAALLRAGGAVGAEPVEERGLGRCPGHGHRFAVEREADRV